MIVKKIFQYCYEAKIKNKCVSPYLTDPVKISRLNFFIGNLPKWVWVRGNGNIFNCGLIIKDNLNIYLLVQIAVTVNVC